MPAMGGMSGRMEETLGLDEGMDEGTRRNQTVYELGECSGTLSVTCEGTTQRTHDNAVTACGYSTGYTLLSLHHTAYQTNSTPGSYWHY